MSVRQIVKEVRITSEDVRKILDQIGGEYDPKCRYTVGELDDRDKVLIEEGGFVVAHLEEGGEWASVSGPPDNI